MLIRLVGHIVNGDDVYQYSYSYSTTNNKLNIITSNGHLPVPEDTQVSKNCYRYVANKLIEKDYGKPLYPASRDEREYR